MSVGISAQTIGRSNHGEEGEESESENVGKDEESESGQKGRGREEKEEDRSDEGGAEEESRREVEAEEAGRTQARPGACRDSGTGAILFRQPEAKTVFPNLGRLEQAKLLAFHIQSAIPIAPGQPAQ